MTQYKYILKGGEEIITTRKTFIGLKESKSGVKSVINRRGMIMHYKEPVFCLVANLPRKTKKKLHSYLKKHHGEGITIF